MSAPMEIREVDSVGKVMATYLSSGGKRVDILGPGREGSFIASSWQSLLAVFLPVGYPNSVTSDYIQYQIYDSLQAFSSSIAGLLSSRAVLEGVGVGDSSASPTAAVLLTIIQDSTGRIATIVFAHRLGSALEPECKTWRLAADVFNDAAMILDCLSPALPKTPRVFLLSASSVLRALCGVAAGSSKASLSSHFAKWDNLGELNAKDSSQETVISLLGMLAGSVIVGYITTPTATWSCLMLLLSIHLAMNHAAVRAVRMHTVNRQRANIVLSHLFDDGTILDPEGVSSLERIFERDGVLRWKCGPVLAWAKIGAQFQSLVGLIGQQNSLTASTKTTAVSMEELIELFSKESHVLWYSPQQRLVIIVLKEGVSATAQLKAWAHALLLVHTWQNPEDKPSRDDSQEGLRLVRETLRRLNASWTAHVNALQAAGWDMDTASLETVSGTRLCLGS